jgi:hypothetical protein
MLVTVDMFSGRPNPSWFVPRSEVRKFAEWLDAAPAVPTVVEPPSQLGFRGLSVQQTEPGELPPLAPTYLRVAAPETAPSPDELATARLLLSTAEAAVEDDVAAVVSDRIDELDRAREVSGPAGGQDLDHDGQVDVDDGLLAVLATAACRERLTPMVLSYWSTPFVQPYNNCYNYATNFVSNTLAQPGRRSGQIYTSFHCDHVLAAARRDSLLLECEGDAGVVALGIWPGIDFHWWRLHPSGYWAHKIGRHAPQTVDNSNRVIGDGMTPANCDRGPYTQFCGYFFVPPWMWVA